MFAKNDKTEMYETIEAQEAETKRVLFFVYDALVEKGYNPVSQIVGYIISEDPTYITNYKNARAMIRRVDRDELLSQLLRHYLKDS